ncbi:acylneuraminate cytidylyltransferase family protein [Vibrio vulnificus]|uniref:acylneuraminate cytidylyltransferase family protein n=1 Tax=Vibrio vulnificus TaxID=672 RepID=UPI000A205FD2|nr:acylneuraminate cytidylyltransferase family protein [Vibrio vulnificus]ARN64728.1 N-Acetylneuraminate cytidylyltransferase [Vibrio vulnificus]ELE1960818.1 acylneuraminate cytidylyltransferase family protein [Vibrio vulnificus]ELL0597889.1 acylneuraminate cytidylyltransferase family protein [Vibrio vulnificus]ELV8702175.1 acylneuraminate cytidylyltransferase family protein [Vibrio vulnificus]ELV8811595.1 acylneuraminate cytidylyltransferase family protein [Vibrio vulnificus]
MNSNKIVAIIPARGGSKGVPKKNIKELNGKPLIAYSIEHALATKEVDKVVVSTDCNEIAEVAIAFGAEVIYRPDDISGDFASSEDALIHSVNELKSAGWEATHVVFLQCTSPIRNNDDIAKTLSLVLSEQFDSALTVVENHRFLWRTDSNNTAIPVNYDPHNRKMRQEIKEYQENGSIYIMKTEDLINTKCRLNGTIGVHVMDEDAGYEIDTQIDFKIIEQLIGGK